MNSSWKKTVGLLTTVASLFIGAQVQALGCYALANYPEFPQHFWGTADYLYWQTQSSPVPVPLVEEGETVVLGGRNISNNWRSGGRFALGCWFEEGLPLNICQGFGVDIEYLFLPSGSRKMGVSSSGLPGSPNYNIPYFDVVTGTEATTPLSEVGVYSGKGTLTIHNNLQGAEANGYLVFGQGPYLKYSVIAGFRYLNFIEMLKFGVSSPVIDTPDVWTTTDKFRAQNNFYGGQLGAGIEAVMGCFFADATFKLGLGAMCEQAKISGKLVTNDYTGYTTLQTFPGGYFALPTNIGHHSRTCFAVVPEVDINFGYQITDCLKVRIGYTFLYVSEMLRAGKIMNPNINPTQSVAIENNPDTELVGEPSPRARLNSEGFWTQGINAGLEFYF